MRIPRRSLTSMNQMTSPGSTEAESERRASEGGAAAAPRPEAPNCAPDLTREYTTPDITVR